MRAIVEKGQVPVHDLWLAFGTNAIYLVLIIWFFYSMFAAVKRQGRLMKLD
jgi:uncharacterized membrane protein YukC